MIELGRSPERRRTRRVAIRGLVAFFGEDGVHHGTLVDVSRGGALIRVLGPSRARLTSEVFFVSQSTARNRIDVELGLGSLSGWARARTVRVTRLDESVWQIAIEFERIDETLRVAIDRATR